MLGDNTSNKPPSVGPVVPPGGGGLGDQVKVYKGLSSKENGSG